MFSSTSKRDVRLSLVRYGAVATKDFGEEVRGFREHRRGRLSEVNKHIWRYARAGRGKPTFLFLARRFSAVRIGTPDLTTKAFPKVSLTGLLEHGMDGRTGCKGVW